MWVRSFLLPVVVIAKACSTVERAGKASGLAWIRWTLCVCARHPAIRNVPGKYGPHSELFFFLNGKEPVAPHEGGAVQALCVCGNAQGVRADWFSPYRSRR